MSAAATPQRSVGQPFLGRIASLAMPLAALALGGMVLATLWVSHGWPLVHDAPLMHYVVFLMDHGRAPYRDIIDINMPGAYMTEWLAVRVLGGGAFGWWVWDVLIGAGVVAACVWIAGPQRRAAGAAAGLLGCMTHLADGAYNLGQRDWLLAALLLGAFGCLFEAIRRRQAAWMAGFMALCGVAASIKPPVAAIAVCFMALACWMARPRTPEAPSIGGGPAAVLGWSVLGGLVPAAIVAAFLLRWGVVGDFLGTMHGLVAWYATLQRASAAALAHKVLVPLGMTAGALVLFALGRGWRRWDSGLLLLAGLAGAALFLIQGKGWEYHRYSEFVFLLLWGMLELDRGVRQAGLQRVVALGWLAVTVALFGPDLVKRAADRSYSMRPIASLEQDLRRLGGPSLSGKVQCLDMTMGGCINVLYRLKLVQDTGFMYDFYLFPKTANAVVVPLRARFLQQITRSPPKVIVISAHNWPGDTLGYDQLDRWPAFTDLLRRNYRLVRELPSLPQDAGYRIYALDGAGGT
jgi:hypothetical protein